MLSAKLFYETPWAFIQEIKNKWEAINTNKQYVSSKERPNTVWNLKNEAANDGEKVFASKLTNQQADGHKYPEEFVVINFFNMVKCGAWNEFQSFFLLLIFGRGTLKIEQKTLKIHNR